jgi:mannose-1-phosphate guanylyltransferase
VAEEYLASGNYYWNSGIFVWKVSTILAELKRQRPKLADAIDRIAAAWPTPQRNEVFRREYEKLEKVSIDFAVMEGAEQVLVIQAPYQWDDVGSWLALERRNPQDAHGNTVQGLHCGVKTSGCVVVSDPDHLVGTIGVKDLIIIQSGNATLVGTRENEGEVKKLVDEIRAKGLGRFL